MLLCRWKRPATRAVQSLVQQLFSQDVRRDKEVGPLVSLPEPKTVLPREKPLPTEKPLTRWQQFAQTKGIHSVRKFTLFLLRKAGGEGAPLVIVLFIFWIFACKHDIGSLT